MTLKFIPPKVEVVLPRYASWTKTGMRTHTSIGAAKQSLANRASYRKEKENLDENTPYYNRYETVYRESFILELVDGEWYTRFHIKDGTKEDDLPWKKEFLQKYQYGYKNKVPFRNEKADSWYLENGYKRVKLATPETKEEYAAWRVAVELEKRGIEA